ncbi:hypothetical protein BE08_27170 [Sorangium cellulosum]|uniref:Uncharacterized protein n=1 Tax=Sorangium cellulosum TaxID=56 RepID=A0A150P168_SORCE|nr:hypothetical protein BE08_27170 [Sorangium cellulosum]
MVQVSLKSAPAEIRFVVLDEAVGRAVYRSWTFPPEVSTIAPVRTKGIDEIGALPYAREELI